MSNFLYLFRGGDDKFNKLSPSEQQSHMEKWGVWMEGLKNKGHLVDGFPLHGEGKVVENKGKVVTNGPFAEGAELVGGYLIVSAKNLDEATEMSKGCPIFEYDASVEVREILSLDM
ncbi:YciI family protein [Spongiivirga sp. MCCC 1A20706]|uniref:YciI family protein n=1 Tax=Spongiivirga sp. MCCC 1A20706 TaxID=3160963 RepID=UPI0039774584